MGMKDRVRTWFGLEYCPQTDVRRERRYTISVYDKKMLTSGTQAKVVYATTERSVEVSTSRQSGNELPTRGVDLRHNLLNLQVFEIIRQFIFGEFAQGNFSIIIANKSADM